jgi:predicted ferric reductase
MAIAATSPALWFATRATGVTALILLTITLALGVANVRRLRTRLIPRFVLDAVHRNAALLAVTFLGAHIATAVLDSYVSIRLIDVVVPFAGAYRPFWLGLGAVSVDLMIAVVATSLLRRHIGYRIWRATHWLAYASWPVALVHSLGTGSDAHTRWMAFTAIGCTLVVIAAAAARLAGTYEDAVPPVEPEPRRRRPQLAGAGGGR